MLLATLICTLLVSTSCTSLSPVEETSSSTIEEELKTISESTPVTETTVTSKELVRLIASPANPSDIAHIFPMGLMSGAHITPVDHQYYFWNDLNVPLEKYPVYSPADGYVINVQFLDNDYIVFIEHSSYVQTEFIHLEKLVGPLTHIDGKVSWGKPVNVRVPVKAGEMIALDGGTNGFDFSVHDYSVTLTGFVNPDSYTVEPWKIHTVDPYAYFIEPVLSQLLDKNVRQIEPLGGEIDYDIPGRLIGNWFVEDTNGYAGLIQSADPIKPDQQIGYWNTHLAIAPDPVDPTTIIVSLGLFDGKTAQLAVKDINPDPENVSAETGLVKYELMDWSYVYGKDQEAWQGITRKFENDIKVRIYDHVRGVVLFQLLDEEHLKMEAFPGMTAAEVSSFTENAKIYVR
ncbi:M23 family metallopeptidase [Chloroflexota bacterium]